MYKAKTKEYRISGTGKIINETEVENPVIPVKHENLKHCALCNKALNDWFYITEFGAYCTWEHATKGIKDATMPVISGMVADLMSNEDRERLGIL
jgi:hypothetical protein